MVGVTPDASAPSRVGRLAHSEVRAEPMIHSQMSQLDVGDSPLTICKLNRRRPGGSANLKRSMLYMQVRGASNALTFRNFWYQRVRRRGLHECVSGQVRGGGAL